MRTADLSTTIWHAYSIWILFTDQGPKKAAQKLRELYAREGIRTGGAGGEFARLTGLLQAFGQIAFVAPGQMRQAQVQALVDGIDRVAEGEEFDGRIDALAPRLLHNRNRIEIEPADQVRSEGLDDWF